MLQRRAHAGISGQPYAHTKLAKLEAVFGMWSRLIASERLYSWLSRLQFDSLHEPDGHVFGRPVSGAAG